MKWIMLLISIIIVTGCNEKNVIQNENKNKSEKILAQKIKEDSKTPSEGEQHTNLQEYPESVIENTDVKKETTNPEEQIIPSISVIEKEDNMQEVMMLEQEVTTLLSKESTITIKENIISKFITLVDFIYYDKPIGNLYFKNLTTNAQEKVKSIMEKMDQAIEIKIPNYKDSLKEKYHKALNYVKTKTANLSDKANEKIEQVLGNENYQNFIDAKNDMKESFQNTKEKVKEETSKVYENGKEKLSNWYQELKKNHQN